MGMVFKTGMRKQKRKDEGKEEERDLKKAVGREGREKGLDISYILYFLHNFRIMVLV